MKELEEQRVSAESIFTICAVFMIFRGFEHGGDNLMQNASKYRMFLFLRD
jgi:hypothetical protein